MLDYEDLCKILKDADFLTPSPNYDIKHINQFHDPHGLLQKVEYQFDKWLKWTSDGWELNGILCWMLSDRSVYCRSSFQKV